MLKLSSSLSAIFVLNRLFFYILTPLAYHLLYAESNRFAFFKIKNPFGYQTGSSDKKCNLSEADIEGHHDGKAEGEGDDADIGVFAFAHLGDEFFDDDVHHRTRRKG